MPGAIRLVVLLLWSAVAAALCLLAAGQFWSVSALVVAIGLRGALDTVLQTRSMDVAGEAQGLAAALNHAPSTPPTRLAPGSAV